MTHIQSTSDEAATDLPVESPTKSPAKWFQIRGRIFLLIPLALIVLALFYGPRQYAQREALVGLKEMGAVCRTQPSPLPGVAAVFGEDYAQEITDIYLRTPDVDHEQLSVVSGLSTVQKIELAGSGADSTTLENLGRLPNLYTLHLADTQVDDAGLPHLSRYKNLGVLSLDRTKITDAGLVHLKNVPQLERLTLDGANITDEGLAHLGQLTSLTDLSCVQTQITDEGLKHLHALKRLKILKVYETGITKEGIAAFHKAVPECVIWEPTEQ